MPQLLPPDDASVALTTEGAAGYQQSHLYVSVVALNVIFVLCTSMEPTLTPRGTIRNTPTTAITASRSCECQAMAFVLLGLQQRDKQHSVSKQQAFRCSTDC